MSGKVKKTYTREFKERAVKLAQTSGQPKAQIARELGIAESLLYSWIERFGSLPRSENQIAEHERDKAELQRLKRELARVTEERDILKKAAAYFAKESRSNARLDEEIRTVFSEHKARYGSPRITLALVEKGISCSENRVRYCCCLLGATGETYLYILFFTFASTARSATFLRKYSFAG